MAIGWISLLSAVPWKDVISTAPAIADSARKLWNTVTKKVPLENTSTVEIPVTASTDAETISIILSKLNSMEITVTELHKQMLASSELIKALANQNTELIKRVEANRVRLRWISGIVFVLMIGVAIVYFKLM
ncbi:MAG TPA: hypothetical protein VES38_09370 [Methylotenera sp.]|nr:hypothetical protein [Methylotenera sp.]